MRPLDLKGDTTPEGKGVPLVKGAPSDGAGIRPRSSIDDTGSKNSATKERLDRLLAEDKSRQDVEDGKVPPHFFAVKRDAEALFIPPWSLFEGDRSLVGTVARSNKDFIVNWAKKYLEELKQYTRRGPIEEREGPSMLEIYTSMRTFAEDHAPAIVCELCATFALEKEPQISLTHSSGRRPFDELARQALLRAARMRSLPEGAVPVRVCYRFSAKPTRMPLLPVVGCTFDESKPDISCFYPTKKSIHTSVEVVSIQPLMAKSGS
jgi:hypothetical protein